MMSWKRIFLSSFKNLKAHEDANGFNHSHDPEKPRQAVYFVDDRLKQHIIENIRTSPLFRMMPERDRAQQEADILRQLDEKTEVGLEALTEPWNAWQEGLEQQIGPDAEQMEPRPTSQPNTYTPTPPFIPKREQPKPSFKNIPIQRPIIDEPTNPDKKKRDDGTFPGYL